MATSILSTPTNYNLEEIKEYIFQNILVRLGSNIIDLEIGPPELEASYNYAIKTYRQRAQNATQESYTLLTLQRNVDTYTLPADFINVRSLFRRTVGLDTGGGGSSNFDPFSSAVLNQMFLLNYNQAGGLATYDFYQGYTKLTARMFGGYLTYTFDPVTKVLRITRDFKGTGEHVLIWADIQRPEWVLLQDPYAGVWITDFILAQCKNIIGEAREKYGTIAGPGGGTTLNGAAMKAEGKADMERLIQELRQYVDGSQVLLWVQG